MLEFDQRSAKAVNHFSSTPATGASPPLALILGIQRPTISDDEFAFFREANPLGLLLARRNMRTPEQTRELCRRFREAVGRPDAPILTDQEGGKISHLDFGAWPMFRSFAEFEMLAKAAGMDLALHTLRLSTLAMGRMMCEAGIDSGCSPVLDLRLAYADPVIGARAFSPDPNVVTAFGRVVTDAFLEVGILPIMKHIPGHGRATADSHKARPVILESADELTASDFVPFAALKHTPWAMVAHVVYTAFDEERPASISTKLINDVIRGQLGYEGVLVSDCVFMNSLEGPVHERVAQVLSGGCDIALHCHGELSEMEKAAAAAQPLTSVALQRIVAADALRGTSEVDYGALHREVETIFHVAGI